MCKINNLTKYDKVMMDTAKLFAEESYCKRRKVGAVLSKDGRILATGYNGTIVGKDNKCEELIYTCSNCNKKYNLNNLELRDDIPTPGMSILTSGYKIECECGTRHDVTLDYVNTQLEETTSDFTLHAEQNVITYCAKEGIPTKDTTLYITTSPCKQCAKLIAQSGIKRVVYENEYKDTSGIDFLKECNIEVHVSKEPNVTVTEIDKSTIEVKEQTTMINIPIVEIVMDMQSVSKTSDLNHNTRRILELYGGDELFDMLLLLKKSDSQSYYFIKEVIGNIRRDPYNDIDIKSIASKIHALIERVEFIITAEEG